MQDRRSGDFRALRRLGLGGLFGDAFAFERDVEQACQRLGDPLEIGAIP